MKLENEKIYVAPEMEILEIEVEKGFEGSVNNGSTGDMNLPEGF